MSTNSVLSGMAAGYMYGSAQELGRQIGASQAIDQVNARAQEYYNDGYYAGIDDGRQEGYQNGWDEGRLAGWNEAVDEATSNMAEAQAVVDRLRDLLRTHNIPF